MLKTALPRRFSLTAKNMKKKKRKNEREKEIESIVKTVRAEASERPFSNGMPCLTILEDHHDFKKEELKKFFIS